MAKEAHRKLLKSIKIKAAPIIIVPDKTYTDDKGNVIPTDVILVADQIMYDKMKVVLDVWGKEQIGIPGQRGDVKE